MKTSVVFATVGTSFGSATVTVIVFVVVVVDAIFDLDPVLRGFYVFESGIVDRGRC